MSIMNCDGCGWSVDTDFDTESLTECEGGHYCEGCMADDLPCGCSESDHTGCTYLECKA
jgi:hypothetical protein